MFPAPAAGPEAPLDMLAACHTRVERQCQTLLNLAAYLPDHGVDKQVREAVQAVTRYFDTAARHHHEDEEQDLLPMLLGIVNPVDTEGLQALARDLIRDHRALEARWAALRVALADWSALPDGTSVTAESVDAAQVIAFVDAYRRHARREDHELFPLAARLLDGGALERLARSMRARRDAAS